MNILTFFQNKVVLVTGSSMGIGKEMVRQILINGGKTVIVARNQTRFIDIENEFENYKSHILFISGDVCNHETCELVVKKTVEYFGRLDIVIANVGLSGYGEIMLSKPGVARQIIDTNIYGTLFPIMTSLPEITKQQGSILIISSIAGLCGLPGYSYYSLSKMSQKALFQSLKVELHSSKVFVGIGYLGFVENETQKRTLNPSGELEIVPKRPKELTVSREYAAYKLLQQIVLKKSSVIYSRIGIFLSIMEYFFPNLFYFILLKKYQKKNH